MRTAINLQGLKYIPLPLVPVVTDGIISLEYAIRVLANADSFASPEFGVALTAVRVMADGKLDVPSAESFRQWAPPLKGAVPSMPLSIAASILVPAHEVERLFKMLREAGSEENSSRLPDATWDEDRAVPREVLAAVRDHCQYPLSPHHRRPNARHRVLDRLREALEEVISTATAAGISIDLKNLPGRRIDLLAILKRIDPGLKSVKIGTFPDYAKDLGLQWRQGSKPKEAMPLLALWGIKPPRSH